MAAPTAPGYVTGPRVIGARQNRAALCWRVEKRMGEEWILMGAFGSAVEAERASRDGFGGECRVRRIGK